MKRYSIIPFLMLLFFNCITTPSKNTDNTDNADNYDITQKDPVVVCDGLIAFYPFDHNSNDCSGNAAYHGKVFGGAKYVQGIDNYCLELDGIDDYVEVTQSSFSLSTYTMVFWINTPGMSNSDTILSRRYLIDFNTNNNPFRPFPIWIEKDFNNGVSRFLPLGDYEVFSFSNRGSIFPQGKWFMFALGVSYDCNTDNPIRIDCMNNDSYSYYPNDTCYNYTISNISKDMSMFIGRFSKPDSFLHFTGKIDEVRIYNRLLKKDEIDSIYTYYSSKIR